MSAAIQSVNNDPYFVNEKGQIGGGNNPALEYFRKYTKYENTRGIVQYELTNNLWVTESISPLAIDGTKIPNADDLPWNWNGKYYYIYHKETNASYYLNLPYLPRKGEFGVRPKTNFFVNHFWEAIGTGLRYATPLEEILILHEGKDFNGVEQDKLEAGVWLVIGLVPGGKILKPVTKVVKGMKVVSLIIRKGHGTVTLTLKKVNNIWQFGGRNNFRFLTGAKVGEEAHHILPWNLRTNRIIQSAAERGFHMNNGSVNGIALKKFFQGIGGVHANHPAYSKFVDFRLRERLSLGSWTLDPDTSFYYLNNTLIPELIDYIKAAEKSGLSLNEYFKQIINPRFKVN